MKTYKTRPYHKLVVTDDTVKKYGPSSIIESQTSWFTEASKYIPENIPRIIKGSNNYYTMNHIHANNAFEYLERTDNLTNILNAVQAITDTLHKQEYTPSQKTVEDDTNAMYFEKPHKAVEKFIHEFPECINLEINGTLFDNPLKLLKKTYQEYEQLLRTEIYSFIHGDLTLSNCIYNQGKIVLLDPRGKFGLTKYYGDRKYDIAKFYYSLVGRFDAFDYDEYKMFKQDKTIEIKMGLKSYINERFYSHFDEDPRLINYLHAIIWLSLISHLDDYNKKLYAYCKGLLLMKQL